MPILFAQDPNLIRWRQDEYVITRTYSYIDCKTINPLPLLLPLENLIGTVGEPRLSIRIDSQLASSFGARQPHPIVQLRIVYGYTLCIQRIDKAIFANGDLIGATRNSFPVAEDLLRMTDSPDFAFG